MHRCDPAACRIRAAPKRQIPARCAGHRQANYAYRGLEQWGYAEGATNSYNGSASYVTGSHNIKVGYQYYWLRQLDETIAADNQLAYRVQRGVPNQVTYRLPTRSNNTVTQLHGIFAAGPVHPRPPDAVGRGPLGSGEQLRAGRGQRRVR